MRKARKQGATSANQKGFLLKSLFVLWFLVLWGSFSLVGCVPIMDKKQKVDHRRAPLRDTTRFTWPARQDSSSGQPFRLNRTSEQGRIVSAKQACRKHVVACGYRWGRCSSGRLKGLEVRSIFALVEKSRSHTRSYQLVQYFRVGI